MKKISFVILSTFLMLDAFPQSNVDRFENRKQKGYFNLTQVSLLMGNRKLSEQNNSYYTNNRNSMLVSPSVTMTCGHIVNEHWAIGIGMGYEIFSHNHFPVFADVRYTFWSNTVSPFFAFKTGYAIGNLSKKHYDELYLDYAPHYVNNAWFRNHGGLMLHPEIGFTVPLSERSDLLFTVAYRFQKAKTTVSQDYSQRYKWEHNVSMNRLSLGMAIMFR